MSTNQWAASVANIFAKTNLPDNLADTKAALARLNDSPSIYDQMIAEER
jgi:hypothetical protein